MIATCMRRVHAAPPQQLRPPRYVGIFSVDEEIRIEELVIYRDVFDHLAPVQRGRRGGAKNIFVIAETSVIPLEAAAIQVAKIGSEINAGGIDRRLEVEGGLHGHELAADGTDPWVHAAGIHEGFKKSL